MKLHPSELALLEYLADACRSWTAAADEALANPSTGWVEDAKPWALLSERLHDPASRTAFANVVAQLLSGLVHTSLASLSHGSPLAETTQLEVRDQSGRVLRSFLHEYWPEHSPCRAI